MAGMRVGTVGLGRHSAAAHPASEAVGRPVLCDTDPQGLAALQAHSPAVAAPDDDLEAMLSAKTLDAVNIVTPDHPHQLRPPQLAPLAESGRRGATGRRPRRDTRAPGPQPRPRSRPCSG